MRRPLTEPLLVTAAPVDQDGDDKTNGANGGEDKGKGAEEPMDAQLDGGPVSGAEGPPGAQAQQVWIVVSWRLRLVPRSGAWRSYEPATPILTMIHD